MDHAERHDGPRRLSESLDEVAGRFGMARSAPTGVLVEQWAEIVGPVVAGHAVPVSLVDGVLTVEVDDNGWATQLRYLRAEIRDRAAVALGAAEVRDLVVRVAPARPSGR